jgi:TetR/AcrR family transcriptional repressor of multidrug resistance operon
MLTDPSTSDKRTLILRATLELLASCGFHGFSMKQLAERAGVAAGTLYLYFKDREELIRQLHQEIIQVFAYHVLAEHDPQAPLQQQYHQICCRFWQFCRDNPNILMSKGQFDHLPPDVLRDHHEAAWQAFQPLTDLFDACRSAGLVKPFCNEILATLGIDLFLNLARKYHLGVITVDERLMNAIVCASWDAIAQHPGNPI